MFGLGAGEVILILLFALIFIGPKKLPELAKGLGKGIREFQKAKDDLMNEVKSSTVDQLTESEKVASKHDPDIPRIPEEELSTGDHAHGEDPMIVPDEDKEQILSREQEEENDPEGHDPYDAEKFAEEGRALEAAHAKLNKKDS
jgi:sec-independent protein translocase protein TatA